VRASWLLLIALALDSCASTVAPLEYLDNGTAATVTVAARSIVFARERPDLAAHAQDYVNITPLQVNRGGQRVLYLYCQMWSTIDRRDSQAVVPPNAAIALLADDRRTVLSAGATNVHSLGLARAPVDPPVRNAEVRVAIVDTELLRFLISADRIRVVMTIGDVHEYFALWKDERASVKTFVDRITR